MKMTSCVLVIATVICAASFLMVVADENESVSVVTYGSTIKLEHVAGSCRLHSHDVSYGTGSGQQSVTCFPHARDANSYWVVKERHSAPRQLSGTPVRCGELIRLQHLTTAKNLHSHDHRAPMNRDYEVSAYAVAHDGRWASGDTADNWMLDCVNGGGVWKRFENVRFKHEEHGNFLTATPSLKFGEPIPDQLHVSAGSRKNVNSVWKTNEGFYLAPPKTKAV